jgi:hypothetical protein
MSVDKEQYKPKSPRKRQAKFSQIHVLTEAFYLDGLITKAKDSGKQVISLERHVENLFAIERKMREKYHAKDIKTELFKLLERQKTETIQMEDIIEQLME